MTLKDEEGKFTVQSHILVWIIGIVFIAGGSYVTFATKPDVEQRDNAVRAVAHQEVLDERAERESDMKEIRVMNAQILQLLIEKQDRRR